MSRHCQTRRCPTCGKFVDYAALVAERDTLREQAEEWQQQSIKFATRITELLAERDSARREREQAVDALRKIRQWCDDDYSDGGLAACVQSLIYTDGIAALLAVELGESKP